MSAASRKKSAGAHAALSLQKTVDALNKFRDWYNPQVGLDFSRARRLIESYTRGDYADLQWTMAAPFQGIETCDADYSTIITRRESALLAMDWDIRTVSERDSRYNEALAASQRAALREAYERISNLTEAISHLGKAAFRGFAHCEKIAGADGATTSLACVKQWNIVRDGSEGAWKYNPEAAQGTFETLPDEYKIDPDNWVITQSERPLSRIALVKWIRQNFCERDWDAFIELCRVAGVITGPPDIPSDGEAARKFAADAEKLASGANGFLPYGATFTPHKWQDLHPLFSGRIEHLQKQLILAGTGGLVTSLGGSVGLNGSGTSEAQADVFAAISRADALMVSEAMQRGIDREVLDARFPGKPRLAYFLIAHEDAKDVGKYIENVSRLTGAGYKVAAAEVAEKTGYAVEDAPDAA
ncbi:MAG: DUF935 family protein, partial [Puniceicoccales bacterium]|nr:DUF935 family protein [Puniceicoccales bacterium]